MNNPFPFSLRWINVQCFEIRLPNGKVILTDPQFSDPLSGFERAKNYKIPECFHLKRDVLKQVDYIIINHTHCDHLIDLGYFMKKFNPLLICHEAVAYELARAFDIPFTSIYAVGSQCSYEFEDFSLQTLNAMHMPQDFVYSNMTNIFTESYGIEGPGTMEIGQLGGLFSMNYMLTTRENLRIGFFAGRMDSPSYPGIRQMAALKPNVLLRQIPVRLPQNPAEIFANEILTTGAQLMLPMHHESFEAELNAQRHQMLTEIFDRINKRLEEKRFAGQAFWPERGKWYGLQIGIQTR